MIPMNVTNTMLQTSVDLLSEICKDTSKLKNRDFKIGEIVKSFLFDSDALFEIIGFDCWSVKIRKIGASRKEIVDIASKFLYKTEMKPELIKALYDRI